MKYSKTNMVETATLTAENVADAIGSLSNLYDKRTTRVYGGAQDGQDDVRLSAALNVGGNKHSRTVDMVAMAAFQGVTGGPLIRYSFDDQTETVVNDLSGNGFDGTKSNYRPTARYHFDGDATDASGNGYHGTPSNVTYGDGLVGGQAAVFNGTTSYISLPSGVYSLFNPVNAFTVSVWLKLDTLTPSEGSSRIVEFRTGGGQYTFRLYFDTTNTRFLAQVSDGIDTASSGGASNTATTGITHLVARWTGSELTLYANNGAYAADTATVGSTAPATGYVGGIATTSNLDATIDEIVILPYAASPDQVAALYNRPLGRSEAVDGAAGNGMSMNGINQRLRRESIPDLGTTWTFAIWMKGNLATGPNGIINLTDGVTTVRVFLNGGGNVEFDANPGEIGNLQDTDYSAGTVRFYVASYNGTTMKLYLDGEMIASANVTITALAESTLTIGALGASSFLDGWVDEFSLYDRALSDDEIATLFSTPAGAANNGQITIALLEAGVEVASQTVEVLTPIQQTYVVAAFDSVDADEVQISFYSADGGEFSIGYLYIGELSGALKVSALNYRVSSADPRNITRAGTALTSNTYLFAEIPVTVVEDAFSTVREQMVEIATDGYASPRFWYFDGTCETCILTGEIVFAILDADSVQLDPVFYHNGEARASATIGLSEVY